MFKKFLEKAVSIVNDLLNKYDGAYVAENLPESEAIAVLSENVQLVNDFYGVDYLEGVNAFGKPVIEPVAVLAGVWDNPDAVGAPSGMGIVTVGSSGLHLFTREDWEQGDTVRLRSFEAWYEEKPDMTLFKSIEWTDVATPEMEVVTIIEVIDQDFMDVDSGEWVDNPTETWTFVGTYVWGQDPVFSETVTYS